MKKNHRHAAPKVHHGHAPRPKCYRCFRPLADNRNEVELCIGCAEKVSYR